MITGHTRVAGLFGYPARYSLSPVIHNAAYEDLGIDAKYLVFPIKNLDDVKTAVRAIKILDLLGVSVTMPYKEAVIPYLDELSSDAAFLQSVNTIVAEGDKLVGYSTDGDGFVESLKFDHSCDISGKNILVLGTGGASRSILGALHNANMVMVFGRNESKVDECLKKACCHSVGGDMTSEHDLSYAAQKSDVIVNTTPFGSHGELVNATPISKKFISRQHIVVDINYSPLETVLIRESLEAGAKVSNGISMLVHQAAAQIKLWTGKNPSVSVMHDAVRDAISN